MSENISAPALEPTDLENLLRALRSSRVLFDADSRAEAMSIVNGWAPNGVRAVDTVLGRDANLSDVAEVKRRIAIRRIAESLVAACVQATENGNTVAQLKLYLIRELE